MSSEAQYFLAGIMAALSPSLILLAWMLAPERKTPEREQ